ncbi:MAG: hypothetical protein R8K48_05795 [Gallionella sp.]
MTSFQSLPPHNATLPSFLRKVVAFALTVVIIIFALMFSVVLFSAVLVVGLIGWGYLWWRSRDLRKQMRDQMAHMKNAMNHQMNNATNAREDVHEGVVIEGEVIRKADPDDRRV